MQCLPSAAQQIMSCYQLSQAVRVCNVCMCLHCECICDKEQFLHNCMCWFPVLFMFDVMLCRQKRWAPFLHKLPSEPFPKCQPINLSTLLTLFPLPLLHDDAVRHHFLFLSLHIMLKLNSCPSAGPPARWPARPLAPPLLLDTWLYVFTHGTLDSANRFISVIGLVWFVCVYVWKRSMSIKPLHSRVYSTEFSTASVRIVFSSLSGKNKCVAFFPPAVIDCVVVRREDKRVGFFIQPE